jgi:hypothetical protein
MTARNSPSWDTAWPNLVETLRRFGFDIEPPRPGEPPASGLIARRDIGERVVLLAIDTSGRFRIEVTWTVAEHAARDEIAGVPVRVVETMERTLTIAGQVDEAERMAAVIAALGALVSWASRSGAEPPVPPAADNSR